MRIAFVALLVAALGGASASAEVVTGDGGVTAFYRWTEPVPPRPGVMLRTEMIEPEKALAGTSVADRILYSSTSAVGTPSPSYVSGAVYVPAGPRPAGGWPVIAWAHGTVGVADVCAPSWRGWLKRDHAYLDAWIAHGYAVVATDYPGLGTPGMHPYLQWRPEAYGILDAARAAIATYGFANRIVIVGQSQGSGAALGAAYAAPSYAPDLDVRGVVATGLVVDLATPVPGAPQVPVPPYAGGGSVDAAYSMLYLLGIDQVLMPGLDPAHYVAPRGEALFRTAATACLTQLLREARDESLDAATAFTAERAGLVAFEDRATLFPSARIAVPVFTGTGLADAEAGVAPQYDFIEDLCAAHTTVSAHVYPGLTHNGAVNASLVDSLPFVATVMRGDPVASTCANVHAPGPLQTAIPGVPFND